ncbi:unnamed protein product [Didymodactylos carnosus]|uniref:Uncharacterized protein n=1 Tax=Didymodactylos carnosus TaxID=1234261 RepID=A0A816BJT6_9BILA|nr:unnamed protein product [Didymodactylos carnosus]CAF1611719.1 unnamed protein product [Didymodactylos carnosus]CAF4000059.1 unnamed protein product [Didymodactylos carnosus]CAF4494888.1 unnamed protein product [Didymodactylos carnosus]
MTSIPPSPLQVNFGDESAKPVAYFMQPVSNREYSDEEYSSTPMTSQIQQNQDQLHIDKHQQLYLISNSKSSPKLFHSPIDKTSWKLDRIQQVDSDDDHNDSFGVPTIYLSNTSIVDNASDTSRNVLAPSDAFDDTFTSESQ